MNKYTTIEHGSTLKMAFPYKTDYTDCEISINFHRTLRIPDDNKKYNLPPSLGHFPLEHIDDFAEKLPENWKEHGGVFFPMHQSEAMWMSFTSEWPFAVKIASGKVNAVSGKPWSNSLEKTEEGETQDYIIVPSQPWLDGFNVSKGVIRQFVSVPLHSGFTVEEQITGNAEFGGIQIMVFPMKEEEFRKLDDYKSLLCSASACAGSVSLEAAPASRGILRSAKKTEMGLGAGGFMKQEVYADKYGIDKWNTEGQRVFVHLLNSLEYKEVTGKNPPNSPLSPKQYQQYGYTWFDYYSDEVAINGSKELSKINSVAQLEITKDNSMLEDNTGFNPKEKKLINLGTKTVKNGQW